MTAPITDDLATTFRYTYKKLQYDGEGAWDVGDNLSYPYQRLIEEGDFVQSSISQTLTYNTLDSTTLAREGIYASLTQEYAGLGGDSEFYKLSGRARYFHLLSDEMDIIGSLAVGAGHVVGTGDDLNVFDQFRVGGRMIRGFENDGIGPRMSNGDAIGGTTYFTTSAEVTFPMPAFPEDFGLRAALFADAGTLYGNDVATNGETVRGTDMSWRASVGAGIQWASPFGSIRVDYAIPVVKEDFDETQEFRFSMANQF